MGVEVACPVVSYVSGFFSPSILPEDTCVCQRYGERKSEKAPSVGDSHAVVPSPFFPPFQDFAHVSTCIWLFFTPLGLGLELCS